ncbi:MAG: glycosyltransferase family 2 protein, partial [Pseudomonadota bacterium]
MYNEEGGAAALVQEIDGVFPGENIEIIIVDDCSSDRTREALIEAKKTLPALRVLRHQKNAGQSRAVRTGVLAARAPIIATLDGDGQNDPADIVALRRALTREGAPPLLVMVAGERQKRQDTAAKKYASRIANAVRSRALNDGAADSGCGLKVFYREAFLRLPYFDHMHRYLPSLMRREGFEIEFV